MSFQVRNEPPAALAAATRRRLLFDLPRRALPLAACVGWLSAAAADPRRASTAESEVETLPVLRSRIELQFAPGFSPWLQSAARKWVRTSADAVARYFGRFPVSKVGLLFVPEEGGGVRGAVTYDEPSLLIRIRLGREATESQLLDDGVLVHEMVRLAIPRVPRAQSWLHEGVATYVQGVARGRVGLVAPATVWHSWLDDMPQGQPKSGDSGLDRAQTWGRMRWGGAMFCLMADVDLLKRSSQRLGLQHALQGVLAAGGHYGVDWPVDRILSTADAAVDQTVLTDLYRRMKGSSEPVDLEGLWRSLGVVGGALSDDAPLAQVRRAILS